MREYNDYIAATKRYLHSYNMFKVSIVNMQDELSLHQQELALNTSMPSVIAKYGDDPGGGTPELNKVEMAAWKRMQIEAECRSLDGDILRVKALLRRIDRAICQLTGEEQYLIKGHYFEDKEWMELGAKIYCTEKTARDKNTKAIRKIAVMLFGLKAEDQARYVFAN